MADPAPQHVFPAHSFPSTLRATWTTLCNVSWAIWRFLSRQYMFLICVLLHLVIVAIHVGLIVVDFKQQQFVAKENIATDLIFMAIIMGTSLVVKTILIVVVFFTQGLALKRNYHLKQSLSALHEKSSAWLGVGPAFVTMFRQRTIRAARLGVFLILTYLACIIALGITDSALLNVGLADSNDPILSRTTSFVGMVKRDNLGEAFPIVNTLPVWNYVLYLGYDDSTVYDLPVLGGKGVFPVNAVRFEVDCRSIPNLRQSGTPVVTNTSRFGNVVTYPFHVDDSLEDVNVIPAPRSLQVLSARPNTAETALPPTIIIASTTIQILDDDEQSSSAVGITPTAQGDSPTCVGSCGPLTSIQLVACNVQAQNTTIKIDAAEGEPSEPVGQLPALWNDWTLPSPPLAVQSFLDPIGEFGDLSPASDTMQSFSVNLSGEAVTSAYNVTMLEDNLMAWLGYYTQDQNTVDLGLLNWSLQQAIALVYWRASFTLAARASSQPQSPGNFVFQVQINKYTPWIGLGLSTVLLILAVILTRQPLASPPQLDAIGSPGVLQVAWLLGNANHYANDLAQKVPTPTLDDLLKAGKDIQVTMREHIEKGCSDHAPMSVRSSGALQDMPHLDATDSQEKDEAAAEVASTDQKVEAEKAGSDMV